MSRFDASHLVAAFKAFAWTDITLAAAMRDQLRSRLLKARATQIAARDRARVMARLAGPPASRSGTEARWITNTHRTHYVAARQAPACQLTLLEE